MIDLHTHTFLSDGVLCPSELVRRCEAVDYRGLMITDHCDSANLERTVTALKEFAAEVAGHFGLVVRAGCELTHVPPGLIGKLTERARALGAHAVLVHGETIVEPVAPGTNLAAIEAGVDVLAHPGLITVREAEIAAERGVLLEVTARKGHSLTNGHVVIVAREAGAKLSFGTDTHSPDDVMSRKQADRVALGAGLTVDEIKQVFANSAQVLGLEKMDKVRVEQSE